MRSRVKTRAPRTAVDALARRAIREFMLSNDLRWADLAKSCGKPATYLRQEYSLGFPSRQIRALIEDRFGAGIFGTRPESAFALRQQQKELLGLHPVFATRADLRALARKVGLVGATHLPNRRALVKELCARCAAVKRSTVPSTSSKPHHD